MKERRLIVPPAPFRGFVSLAVALAVVALILAGCGGAPAPDTTGESAPTAAPPDPAETDAGGQQEGTMGEGSMGDMEGMSGGHGGSNSAAYMTLINTTETPDALVRAATDVAETVELHTVIEEQGVMKMRPVEQITIPANGSQELRPGGYHIMLLNITEDLTAGEHVSLTLTLQQAGEIQITAPVGMMAPEEQEGNVFAGPVTVENPWVRSAVRTEGEGEMDMEHEGEGEGEVDMEHEGEGEMEHTHTTTSSLDLSALTPIAAGETLQVVATTSIVGDVVGNVAGEQASLTVLLPVGTDPHTFEPTPRDFATLSDADLIFINGMGLEQFLDSMLEGAGVSAERVVSVSHGIEPLELDRGAMEEGDEHEGDEHEGDEHEGDEHNHGHTDPHVWFSPVNVEQWVQTIEQSLSHADPAHAETYAANASAYREELQTLDDWIAQQVEQIPAESRKLVTDHTVFGYFAHRYGFEQVGAVIPGYSTMTEPSAQQLAALQDTIREHDVPAIFVGATVNPDLSEQVANDTGTELVRFYTGSLSEADGPAATYLEFMRFNTRVIVDALAE